VAWAFKTTPVHYAAESESQILMYTDVFRINLLITSRALFMVLSGVR